MDTRCKKASESLLEVLKGENFNHQLLQSSLKILRHSFSNDSGLKSIDIHSLFERLLNIFEKLLERAEHDANSVDSVCLLCYSIGIFCGNPHVRERYGASFVPQICKLVFLNAPDLKLLRAALESLCNLISSSPRNQDAFLYHSQECQKMFTELIFSVGDFGVQSALTEILFRITRRKANLVDRWFHDPHLRSFLHTLRKKNDVELRFEILNFVSICNEHNERTRSVWSFPFTKVTINEYDVTFEEENFVHFSYKNSSTQEHLSFYMKCSNYTNVPDVPRIIDVYYRDIIDFGKTSSDSFKISLDINKLRFASQKFIKLLKSSRHFQNDNVCIAFKTKKEDISVITQKIFTVIQIHSKVMLPEDIKNKISSQPSENTQRTPRASIAIFTQSIGNKDDMRVKSETKLNEKNELIPIQSHEIEGVKMDGADETRKDSSPVIHEQTDSILNVVEVHDYTPPKENKKINENENAFVELTFGDNEECVRKNLISEFSNLGDENIVKHQSSDKELKGDRLTLNEMKGVNDHKSEERVSGMHVNTEDKEKTKRKSELESNSVAVVDKCAKDINMGNDSDEIQTDPEIGGTVPSNCKSIECDSKGNLITGEKNLENLLAAGRAQKDEFSFAIEKNLERECKRSSEVETKQVNKDTDRLVMKNIDTLGNTSLSPIKQQNEIGVKTYSRRKKEIMNPKQKDEADLSKTIEVGNASKSPNSRFRKSEGSTPNSPLKTSKQERNVNEKGVEKSTNVTKQVADTCHNFAERQIRTPSPSKEKEKIPTSNQKKGSSCSGVENVSLNFLNMKSSSPWSCGVKSIQNNEKNHNVNGKLNEIFGKPPTSMTGMNNAKDGISGEGNEILDDKDSIEVTSENSNVKVAMENKRKKRQTRRGTQDLKNQNNKRRKNSSTKTSSPISSRNKEIKSILDAFINSDNLEPSSLGKSLKNPKHSFQTPQIGDHLFSKLPNRQKRVLKPKKDFEKAKGNRELNGGDKLVFSKFMMETKSSEELSDSPIDEEFKFSIHSGKKRSINEKTNEEKENENELSINRIKRRNQTHPVTLNSLKIYEEKCEDLVHSIDESSSISHVLMLIANMYEKLKKKVEYNSTTKVESVVNETMNVIEEEMKSIKSKLSQNTQDLSSTVELKFAEIEKEIADQGKTIKDLFDRFVQDFNNQLQKYDEIYSKIDAQKILIQSAISENKSSHKQMLAQMRDKTKQILNDTERRLASIEKAKKNVKVLGGMLQNTISELPWNQS